MSARVPRAADSGDVFACPCRRQGRLVVAEIRDGRLFLSILCTVHTWEYIRTDAEGRTPAQIRAAGGLS